MSERQQHPDTPTEGTFDCVMYGSPSGVSGTLTGELWYTIDGFDWQCVTDTPERVTNAEGSTAAGVVDGEMIAKGVIYEILFDDDGRAELFVTTPH